MQTRTRRQREVIEFISRYIDAHGFEPSYQQIAHHLGISSKAAVAKHVKALESQGLVSTRKENGRFSLELCNAPAAERRDEVIYWLDHFGSDDRSEDLDREPFTVPGFLLGSLSGDRVAAFRVPDSMMEGENICEGDIALIEHRSFARDGEIIAAAVRKAPTVLRRYYRSGPSVELRTSEGFEGSMVLSADKISVLGVYRGLLRVIK